MTKWGDGKVDFFFCVAVVVVVLSLQVTQKRKTINGLQAHNVRNHHHYNMSLPGLYVRVPP